MGRSSSGTLDDQDGPAAFNSPTLPLTVPWDSKEYAGALLGPREISFGVKAPSPPNLSAFFSSSLRCVEAIISIRWEQSWLLWRESFLKLRLQRGETAVSFRDDVFEFHGGASARDGCAYFNRRAEVWGMMLDWLKVGAEIPDDPEIEVDLTGVQYGYSAKQQIQLEKKEDMKRRGMASPDLGDALAMSFSVTVQPKQEYVEYEPMPHIGIWS